MNTNYGDCRVDLREHKDLILSSLFKLDNIKEDIVYTLIADGAIHNIAVNDAKVLAKILNTRGLQNAKHIVYVPENYFVVLEMYNRYNQQRPLVKQALTDDGIARIQQATQLISCHKLLDRLHMSVLQLWSILQGYESPADDIYALLSSCGSEVCQKYVAYPLTDAYDTVDRPAYKSKAERNLAIIQMYVDGAGLRQLENAGFGIKRAAILSVLQQSGVYKGADEGKARHNSGNWRTSGYRKYDSTANKAIKISKSKRSSSKKQRKVLYELRRNSALTQQQISDLLGCSKTYYCNVENGRETPAEAFWSKLIALLGLTTGCEDVRKVSTVKQHAKVQNVTEDLDKENAEEACDNILSRYERPYL